MNFNKAEFFRAYGEFSQLPKSDRIEIAFAGRSNVGKSSLINKVFNRKNLARVSAVPGKTATINFYSLENIYLVDLPGYGYAKVAKSEKGRWSELIEGYFNQDRRFALVVSLVDIRHDPSALDMHMAKFLWENDFPFAIALTKADKLSKQAAGKQASAIRKKLDLPKDIPFVVTSSSNGTGIDELRRLIDSYVAEA